MKDAPRLSAKVGDALAETPHRILVTGAGGWIGLATLELLHNTLGADAFVDRVIALGSTDRQLHLRDGTTVRQRPLTEIAHMNAQPTMVLHLAFLTKDRAEQMDEDDYIRANRAVSATVLDNLDRIGATSVFVASSGAARFADDENASVAMRLYGSLKREDERSFAAWAEDHGARAVIARLFNLSGPYINKHETYALASFILDALAGRPIEVKATRKVVRGYVAIRELMSLVFALLLKGTGVTRFDTGGTPMEMQEIAEEVSRVLGPVPVTRRAVTDERADEYVGNGAAYAKLIEEREIAAVTFSQQVAETAVYLSTIERERREIHA